MSTNSKKKIRSTAQQIRYLVDFMSLNPSFAAGEFRGPLGGPQMDAQWWKLRHILAEWGPDKSVEQWKQSWRDLKKKARHENLLAEKAEGDSVEISDMSKKILTALAQASSNSELPQPSPINTEFDAIFFGPMETGTGRLPENAEDTSLTEKQIKKLKNGKIFEKVRRYCVALIKECGRPIEMMDDIPFKNLVSLLVVSESERKQLTATAIKEYMETAEDVAEDTLDDTAQADDDDHDLDNDGADSDYAPPGKSSSTKRIKGEKMQCRCEAQDDDDPENHKISCPVFANTTQHYWAYFEVSVDDARCKECHSNVKWTTMSDLKSHLDVFHSHLAYKDDDDTFNEPINRAHSEASFDANQIADEVYIETDLSSKPPTAKKRRLPSFTPQKYVTLRDSQTITLDRFKCLDRFGLYIAALMKMLPEDKCIKYQEQIVNRLLKEQAAAG